MFETGVRQFRMAMSMVWGRPINVRNVERLIGDALATLDTFGVPGTDLQEMLDGPFADPAARSGLQERALRRTASRLFKVSPYYGRMFADLGISPKDLTLDDLPSLPVTTKKDLIRDQEDFVAIGSHPYLTTRTTGTTGDPAEIWLSEYEIELWPALAALSGLLRGEISPQDVMQINISSRATAAVQQNLATCRLVGARARVLGVIPPDRSLDSLMSDADGPATLLATYPSYLGQLVKAARRRGLGPSDFMLKRVGVGGEILSESLAFAAMETLGCAAVNDTFAMTEILPVSGRTCSHGHLHHDLNAGLVEVIDLQSGSKAAPGSLGTVVVTPYYPYRECMPVFRYDTRDVVRCLPDDHLSCDLAGTPATSAILGKASQVIDLNGRTVTPREIVELFESLPGEPWPARYGVRAAGDVIEITLPELVPDRWKQELYYRSAALNLPLRLAPVRLSESEAVRMRPVRADLVENTFA